MIHLVTGRTIGQRLGLVLGLVLLISTLGSGLSHLALSRIAVETESMFNQDLIAERTASDWHRYITNGVTRTSAIAASADTSLTSFFAATGVESTKRAGELQKQLDAYMVSPEEREMYETVGEARKVYLTSRDAVTSIKKAGDAEQARQIFDQQFLPAAAKYQEAIQGIVQHKRASLDEAAKHVADTNASARTGQLVFSLVALCLGIWLAVMLSRSITRPLRGAVDVADAIARFDLSHSVPKGGNDETGALLGSLSGMQVQLHKLIGDVRSSAESIGTASAEIAVGNHDLSARTEQTASSLQEVAASMTQLTGTVRQTADSAMTANQLSISAAETAQRGGSVMGQVVSTMSDISDRSRKIGDIIGVIDGIAFQTNILALNAAVEAARAGEQGRGFAVVASEVRLLAQRSAEAAKQIKSLIGASMERVESGSALVHDAGSAMTEIVSSVQRVADIIGEISAAAREQSDGINQVNAAVGQLDQLTQQNAALVEESAAAAESLKDQSQRLATAISVFRLR
ncbi:methyl-accepting chemotaxis protein [Roseateles amylovorans]|uniref:methyl-accepting chemotaxis protein n=1 Tax=Roseateles amylovorans TaxID=2978473 RepID=UPI0025B62D87|nr:methyl-accepting chemotaxis protein [Roseateles amylovorans]